ncbi:MAG: hypothetical protein CVU00_08095 [Bacteroidetes bacterium HGW-Bacteroidetes-17]|nr:MAG: hypothetical protein CVU00_08095 [Bacteroidetes bacterium HGW-Bacteroidetes-17]
MKDINHSENNIIKILIAEDSPTQAEELRYILEKHEYFVVVAKDGEEAHEMVIKHKPSLIISDIMMPKMNGYELCKKIKSDQHNAHIPVILLTSLSNSADVIEGLACGADNFITKPYDEDYLLTHILKVLQNRGLIHIKKEKRDIEVLVDGKKRQISADQQQMFTLLLSTFDAAMHKNNKLLRTQEELQRINENQEEQINKRTVQLREEIAKHQKTETELLESERRVDLAVKSANMGLWDLDLINETTWRTIRHDQIFGYESLQPNWNLKIFMSHVLPEDREDVKQSVEEAFTTKKLQFECQIKGIDRLIRWISVHADVQHDQKDKPIRMIGSVMDITERKQAELEIELKNKELQKINNEKDLLFSIIAHDLRSPFNAFLGLTEILADEALSLSINELTSVSKRLNESAKNLHQLLENLLEWSLLQKGSMQFSPKKLDLSELIDKEIEYVYERAYQKEISLVNEVHENFLIYGDEKMIHTILRNLLSNAVKYTNKGERVFVKSKILSNKMIEISVSDSGIGMSKDILKKIFSIGEKVGFKGTEGELSTGLGLVLCKEFVENHGGKIWAKSEVNKGSTFSFTIKNEKLQ